MGDYVGWLGEGLAVAVTIGAVSTTVGYLMVAATVIGGIVGFALRRSKIR